MSGGHQTQAGQKTSDRLVLFVSLPPVNQRVVGSRMGRTTTSFELTEAFIPLIDFKKKKKEKLLFKRLNEQTSRPQNGRAKAGREAERWILQTRLFLES